MYSLYVQDIVQIINWINNWYGFILHLDSFRGDNILELFAMVMFSEDIPEDFVRQWKSQHFPHSGSGHGKQGSFSKPINYSRLHVVSIYRSGTANSNTVYSKFHLIRSFNQDFARFLSFHV